MSKLCTRCALRLQRAAAQADASPATTRAFSQSTARRKHHGLPVFQPTTNPELQDLLTSFRNKHVIPAYLRPSERRLIFGTKHRQLLVDNPRTTQIGDDEVPLTWIDRRTEIPNRARLFNKTVDLMTQGESKDWANLPALLIGMKSAGAKMEGGAMGRVVRKANNAGRLGAVIQCLQQVEHTGLTLKDEAVLSHVMWALHDLAQRDAWSAEATEKAMKWANVVGLLLETEEHGGGKTRRPGDARQRPEVIGVVLELAAVQAYKHQGGKDVDGKVKMYTERLLACIGDQAQPPSHAPSTSGPQVEMLNGVPIYHGLLLAEKVIGPDLPHPTQAKRIRADYEAGLTILAQAIEAQRPREGSYGAGALRCWRECLRE